MKKLIAAALILLNFANANEVTEAIKYRWNNGYESTNDNVSTQVSAMLLGPTTFVAGGIVLLPILVPFMTIWMTAAEFMWDRAEVEQAIERNDKDMMDSIRDMVRHNLVEEGQIEDMDQLSDKDVDLIINAALSIPEGMSLEEFKAQFEK